MLQLNGSDENKPLWTFSSFEYFINFIKKYFNNNNNNNNKFMMNYFQS